MHWYKLGADRLESSFLRQATGFVVGNKLTVSLQHALAAKKASSFPSCITKRISSRSGEVILTYGFYCVH